MSDPEHLTSGVVHSCDALLGHDDARWLNRLTDEEINDTWLELANALIVVGLANDPSASRKLSSAAGYARDYFYEDLIGFGRPESPSYHLDARFVAKQHSHAPLDRFIGIMRLYDGEDLDVLKASRSLPEAWTLKTETVSARIEALRQKLGRAGAHRLLQSSVRPLASPDYIERIDPFMQVATLGTWSHDEASTLLELRPTVLNNNKMRLLLLSRYILTFGNEDLTPSQAGNLLMVHPDRHLIALDDGIPRYTHSYIQKATRELSTDECATVAQSILEKPEAKNTVGAKIVQLHQRYHQSLNQPTAA